MKHDAKDVAFCPQGKHIVHRDEMTKMLCDNGKTWRRVCTECKDKTLRIRAEITNNKRHITMNKQTEIEKCTVYSRRGDRCEIKCKLGLWSVEGQYGLALMNEANHYFQQYKDDGEYDKLLASN